MKTPEQKAEEYVANAYIVFPQSAVKTAYIAGYNAGYNAANEWISVEDELPENETYINLKLKNGDFACIFYETRSDLIMLKRDCTHWKPIN